MSRPSQVVFQRCKLIITEITMFYERAKTCSLYNLSYDTFIYCDIVSFYIFYIVDSQLCLVEDPAQPSDRPSPTYFVEYLCPFSTLFFPFSFLNINLDI